MIDIAVVGATGEVGRTALAILAERNFPVGRLFALASERSAGATLHWRDKDICVEALAGFDPRQVKIAIFSAGSAIAREYAPSFLEAGCTIIDNSSAFRNDDDKLLIVPEVNGHLVTGKHPQIIGNPNCTTIQIVVALAPLNQAFGVTRVIASTYQAVSGAGRKGILKLEEELADRATSSRRTPKNAHNVVPQIDDLDDSGFTFEEIKVRRETQKILGKPSLPVACTAVRVPVFNGHAVSLCVELGAEPSLAKVRSILSEYVTLSNFPTPLDLGPASDDVRVGRLRVDPDFPNILHLWVVADNLRKGAALNAIQIAELLV